MSASCRGCPSRLGPETENSCLCKSFATFSVFINTYSVFQSKGSTGFTSYLRESFEMGHWHASLMHTEAMIVDHEKKTRTDNKTKLWD